MTESVEAETDFCQYYYPALMLTTKPDERAALALRRYWWSLKRHVWYASIIGPRRVLSEAIPIFGLRKKIAPKAKAQFDSTNRQVHASDFEAGDWVEVRSAREIFSTLDAQGKLKGLRFTPEMAKFCGNRFRVYKRVDKILLETTGELRKIRTPTFLLENVFCDGGAHGSCDRSCFCFWRQEWLKKANS